MGVRERITSLKLIEKKKENTKFFAQIGVTAELRINDGNSDMEALSCDVKDSIDKIDDFFS